METEKKKRVNKKLDIPNLSYSQNSFYDTKNLISLAYYCDMNAAR